MKIKLINNWKYFFIKEASRSFDLIGIRYVDTGSKLSYQNRRSFNITFMGIGLSIRK